MIAVIADDLSGAAELAGIAARYGYRAEVHTVFDPKTDADIVAIDTDTRWRSAEEAARIVADVASSVLRSGSERIFKKTDSVLRGNVRAEIEAILAVTGQPKSLLIAANPSKARIIRGGVYFIDEIPLHQSAFARDVEHPRRTSVVAELLKLDESDGKLHAPDIGCVGDVVSHAAEIDPGTLPAGGADFFEAILQTEGRTKIRSGFTLTGPTLFVCGSAAAWDNGRGEECLAHAIPVFPMPEQIFNGDSNQKAMKEWCDAISSAQRKQGRAMLAIGRCSTDRSKLQPRQLLDVVAQAVAEILASEKIESLALEGGSTAAAILKNFGWKKLKAVPAELTGIAALSVAGVPTLLIKPGSYPWPGLY